MKIRDQICPVPRFLFSVLISASSVSFKNNTVTGCSNFASNNCKKMEQKTKRNTPGNILMAVAALFFAACSNSHTTGTNKETDNAVAVRTETLAATPMSDEIVLSGNVEGGTTVKLGFMVPGKINLITKQEGQFVAKGQLLSSLDPANYALNKQLADVELDEIQDEHARLKVLHERRSLSENDFSKIGFSLQKAQVQQKLEARNLGDTKLYAPIAGVLLDKQAEAGEIVSAGSPLFVISDISRIKVLAFVPEAELSGLHIGQIAQVKIAALGKTFKGKIAGVGAVADAASRAFTVKIEVDNPGFLIRPGMIAEAKVRAGSPKEGIQLPMECVINDLGNQSSVYVTDQAGLKAFKRKVSLGSMFANKIEILSGLSVGETVVTAGQTKLSDGSSIIIEK
jgi:membrane fusion protein (multidrug efflux system)